MKKTALILFLLLPAVLLGQKGHYIFKIQKPEPQICLAAIDSIYWDYESVPVSALLHPGKIEIIGNCGDSAKVVRFDMALGINGIFMEMTSNSDSLTMKMRDSLARVSPGGYVIFKDIQYATIDKQIHSIEGLSVKIGTNGTNINKKLHYPFYIAALGGLWRDTTLTRNILLQTGKLEPYRPNSDSSKIISFIADIGINGILNSYTSNSKYLTKQMVAKIKQLPQGSYIIFHNIMMRLPNGNIRIAIDFEIRFI